MIPGGAVLLAEVTAGAQSLAVLEAGRPALGEGHDVVHVAHGSVAEWSAAGVIPPDQEASQRRRELTAPGFDTDHIVTFSVDPTLSGHSQVATKQLFARPKSTGQIIARFSKQEGRTSRGAFAYSTISSESALVWTTPR